MPPPTQPHLSLPRSRATAPRTQRNTPPQQTTPPRNGLFALLLLLRALRLGRPPALLPPVLPLLALLSTRLLDLSGMPHPHQPIMRLELLHRLDRVVDERKARGFAAAVLGAHAEDVDLVLVRLVDFGEFGAEVVFADVGAVGVEYIAGEERSC